MNETSERISEFFSERSRDITPASADHSVRVLYTPVSCDVEVSKCCVAILSDAELQRRARFAVERDKVLFEQRRAFRRFCGATALGSSQPLSQIEFQTTENGRPYLSESPDLWFSFSCCRSGLLGAWSTTHAIGVDLEDPMKDLEAVALARQFFSVAEAKVIETVSGRQCLRTFYRFWNLKEAALKSIGEGLPYGLDAFKFELDPRPRVVHAPTEHGGPERFSAYAIEGIDSCAALVVQTPRRVQTR